MTSQPKVTRPHFPPGYIENPKGWVSWQEVLNKLTRAENYWLCTVRPDGRPHVIPKWAVMIEGKIYFDGSPKTRHARNIAMNPNVCLHLESGSDVVIVEGHAAAVDKVTPELGVEIARAYTEKYAKVGYSPTPDQWDGGGLYVITPRQVMAWTNFNENPTKFMFDSD